MIPVKEPLILSGSAKYSPHFRGFLSAGDGEKAINQNPLKKMYHIFSDQATQKLFLRKAKSGGLTGSPIGRR